jgi:hypothetical protein
MRRNISPTCIILHKAGINPPPHSPPKEIDGDFLFIFLKQIRKRLHDKIDGDLNLKEYILAIMKLACDKRETHKLHLAL